MIMPLARFVFSPVEVRHFPITYSAIYMQQRNFHWRMAVSNVLSGYFSCSLEIWSSDTIIFLLESGILPRTVF